MDTASPKKKLSSSDKWMVGGAVCGFASSALPQPFQFICLGAMALLLLVSIIRNIQRKSYKKALFLLLGMVAMAFIGLYLVDKDKTHSELKALKEEMIALNARSKKLESRPLSLNAQLPDLIAKGKELEQRTQETELRHHQSIIPLFISLVLALVAAFGYRTAIKAEKTMSV